MRVSEMTDLYFWVNCSFNFQSYETHICWYLPVVYNRGNPLFLLYRWDFSHLDTSLIHNGLFWPYQLSVSSPTSEWKCNVTEVMCASSRLITHTHAHEISAEAETTETMMKRGIRLPVNINQSSILQSVSNGIPAESTVNRTTFELEIWKRVAATK